MQVFINKFSENWKSSASDKIEDLKEKFFNETDLDEKKDLKAKNCQAIQEREARF